MRRRPRWGSPEVPEAPQVQALAEYLDQRFRGQMIATADLAAFSVLKTFDPPFTDLQGSTVIGVSRRGKFLIVSVATDTGEPRHLVIHFALAGWVRLLDGLPDQPARPGRGPLMLRLGLVTTDGEADARLELTEAGTRKSTSVWLVNDPADIEAIRNLGIDVYDLALPSTFKELIRSNGAAQIKGTLRKQSVIAGIGNAYSDEVLHRAKLSPFAPGNRLEEDQLLLLLQSIQDVFGEALEEARGRKPAQMKDAKRSGMAVHGKAGEACPVCGDTVAEVSFAERALQYCPTCQTGGKKLADRRLSKLLK